jgi:hypothetical protein
MVLAALSSSVAHRLASDSGFVRDLSRSPARRTASVAALLHEAEVAEVAWEEKAAK